MPSGWLSICSPFLLRQVGEDFILAQFAGRQHGELQDAVFLAFGHENPLAVRREHDAVGIGEPAGAELRLAGLVDVMDGADRVVDAESPGIGEIEAAVWRIERQVIRPADRLAVAACRRRS